MNLNRGKQKNFAQYLLRVLSHTHCPPIVLYVSIPAVWAVMNQDLRNLNDIQNTHSPAHS